MTYVDSVSVITATRPRVNSHRLKAAQNNFATLPVNSYDREDSTLDARCAVMWW